MGKIYWFTAVAVLAVAGIVAWAAPTTHARVVASTAIVHVEPFQLMANAKNLPVAEFEDYSLVFSVRGEQRRPDRVSDGRALVSSGLFT